ncbi:MAG: hypothetical protein P4L31_04760 [Candidatus Babeliales bacterium]|nr:hypothetical protein [Candidatus Babeliales bacterium]
MKIKKITVLSFALLMASAHQFMKANVEVANQPQLIQTNANPTEPTVKKAAPKASAKKVTPNPTVKKAAPKASAKKVAPKAPVSTVSPKANVKIVNQTNEVLQLRFHCTMSGLAKKPYMSKPFTINPNTILPIMMTDIQFAQCHELEVLTDDAGWYKVPHKFTSNKDGKGNILFIGQKKK